MTSEADNEQTPIVVNESASPLDIEQAAHLPASQQQAEKSMRPRNVPIAKLTQPSEQSAPVQQEEEPLRLEAEQTVGALSLQQQQSEALLELQRMRPKNKPVATFIA